MPVTEDPWPPEDEEVRAALEAAYRDGSWGKYHGPHRDRLCETLQQQFATEHALLCSSGTIGVELALRGCGVEPGDQVLLAGYDFPGNFRAIEAVGARPILIDVDPTTWCLDASQLANVDNKKVAAVIVSHLHGGLADMPKIMHLAHERNWSVIEDACQQPGAQLTEKPVGSWGDVGVLSFGGSKLLTAGRGGAVITNDTQIHQRIKVYAERGNEAFPLSELQAAVLLPQLSKLEARNRQRSESVASILVATDGLKQWLRPVTSRKDASPAYYKLAWSLIPAESQQELREELLVKLQAADIPIDVGFRGFTRRSERRCDRVGSLENSKRLSQSTLLLHHPILLAQKKATQQIAQALDHEVRQWAS